MLSLGNREKDKEIYKLCITDSNAFKLGYKRRHYILLLMFIIVTSFVLSNILNSDTLLQSAFLNNLRLES